jgi:hypothetical protein
MLKDTKAATPSLIRSQHKNSNVILYDSSSGPGLRVYISQDDTDIFQSLRTRPQALEQSLRILKEILKAYPKPVEDLCTLHALD